MNITPSPSPALVSQSAPALIPQPAPTSEFSAPEQQLLPKLPLPVPGDPGNTKPGAPPKDGSLVHKAELTVVRLAAKTRTPAGDAWAKRLDEKMGLPVWLNELKTIKQNHGVFAAAKGAAMLTGVLAANTVATHVAKRNFDRDRPFEYDPSITTVVAPPHGQSYPSGHASQAFAAARVLSHFEPERTMDLYQLAGQVAASRVYAGVHYPSDVIAGAALGAGIAHTFMSKLPGK